MDPKRASQLAVLAYFCIAFGGSLTTVILFDVHPDAALFVGLLFGIAGGVTAVALNALWHRKPAETTWPDEHE